MKKIFGLSLLSVAALLLVACPGPDKDEFPTSDYVLEKAGNVNLNLAMVYVQGGEFVMGATPEQTGARDDEKPAHKVKLSTYCIGKYEITQAQYQAVMGENPSSFKGDDLPVEQVSWLKAVEFCNKLSALTGHKYVLPTEAQWEFAARGGVKSKGYLYSGSNDINEVAWYMENSGVKDTLKGGSTHPVGTLKANELGIHDMSGNVWEWCADWYGPYTTDSVTVVTDPTGAPETSGQRVLRGCGWDYKASSCRVSKRGAAKPDFYVYIDGFRVARVR